MKYDNIKYYKLSHSEIAKAFGYKSVNSFRSSSAHRRIMVGLDLLLGRTKAKATLPPFDISYKIGKKSLTNGLPLLTE